MITYFLCYFFDSNLYMVCLLQLFLIKRSNIFFSIKIFCYISQELYLTNFDYNEKMLLFFLYSYMSANFKLRIFFIIFKFKINICIWINIDIYHKTTLIARNIQRRCFAHVFDSFIPIVILSQLKWTVSVLFETSSSR